ncbi:MAG: phosphotransferase [Desulfobacterales bacterium]|nr:phosphotransferase [Desulfobacterales bacterium]
MKALILAAGFGTRLAPYTRSLPKPLFTINNTTVLDLAISRLLDCGCEKIFINTHHLSRKIDDFFLAHPCRDRLELVHEPEILDTGGAVANLKASLSGSDFLVMNADIVCDMDLKQAVAAHKASNALATLVVHDFPRFNKLKVEMEADHPARGRVIHFEEPPGSGLAFTGIQVLSPGIFQRMPDTPVFSSIEVYKALCPTGKIKAFVADGLYWSDIGTPESYRETSRQCLAGRVFNLPLSRLNEVKITPIAGDGSDRLWYRAAHGSDSLVISDHGICLQDSREAIIPGSTANLSQLKAFTAIGSHLNRLGIAVPKILGHDTLSGQVALEDLGSVHLADLAGGKDDTTLTRMYQQVIDRLIEFSQAGKKGFNPDWTCQTRTYSKDLILNLECRYFLDAFVQGYLGKDTCWHSLEPAFSYLADQALAHGFTGLMHRDCQSRNIMIRENRPWFIDFQSARIGPLQYDLASLLIDPYVTLPDRIQNRLVDYAVKRLNLSGTGEAGFRHSYEYCCLTRNLQMLGAFGFLTRVKNKPGFESFIPAALAGLNRRLEAMNSEALAPLTQLVSSF